VFVSQLVAGTLVLQEWPTESPTLRFLLTPAILALVAAVVLSLPLYGVWRVLGTSPREYRRVLVLVLYQVAFVGLGFSLSILVSLMGLNLTSPATVTALARDPTLEGLLTSLKALESMPPSAPPVVAAIVSSFLMIVLLVWLLVTWRAYQAVLHQPARRAWAALGLFVLACFIPLGLLAWVARFVESV
jgi:hypothetical protein